MALQWVQYANLSVQQQSEASPLSCTSLCYCGWLLDLGGTGSFGGYRCFCQGESVLSLRTLAQMRRQDLQRKVRLCSFVSDSKLSSEYIQPPRL